MNKKYELTDETKIITVYDPSNEIILYRIRALKNFRNVRAGDLGGWIEKEENLSQEGNCWVYDNACVFENAYVFDDGTVCHNSSVCGNAIVYENASVYDNSNVRENACVFGNSIVCDNSVICNNAKVYGISYICCNVIVRDNAKCYGNSVICDNSIVCGYARVRGNAVISGDSFIKKTRDYLTVGPVGSRNGTTTFTRDKESNIVVTCGCFHGTIDEFEEAVNKTHGNNLFAKEYRAVIELAKIHFGKETKGDKNEEI